MIRTHRLSPYLQAIDTRCGCLRDSGIQSLHSGRPEKPSTGQAGLTDKIPSREPSAIIATSPSGHWHGELRSKAFGAYLHSIRP